jgi:hypothetical protein
VNESAAIHILKRNLTAMILTVAFPVTALAGDHAQWDNLRELRLGQRIGIVQSDLVGFIFAFFGWWQACVAIAVGTALGFLIRFLHKAQEAAFRRLDSVAHEYESAE